MQVLKLAKKAAKRKQIKRGVKEVIKAIRKKNKGYANSSQFFNYFTIFVRCRLPPAALNFNFIFLIFRMQSMHYRWRHLPY